MPAPIFVYAPKSVLGEVPAPIRAIHACLGTIVEQLKHADPRDAERLLPDLRGVEMAVQDIVNLAHAVSEGEVTR